MAWGEYFRRIFSQNVFAEYFTEKVFSRFLVLKPHFESGPAWGLGLTGWGLGAVAWGEYFRRIFSQNVFAEYIFAEYFTEKVFSRFLVLKPHFESGPAWGLGLTSWGLGAVAWGEYFRRIFAQNIFGEAFSRKRFQRVSRFGTTF